MILGITGGIGSGKSTVLHILKKEYGANIYIADEYGHRALIVDSTCYKPIVETFGKVILDEYGEIKRDKLSEIVYADDRKLKMLNSIIHPFVWDCIEQEMERDRDSDLKVVESAILFEAGYDKICDKIFGVFSSKAVRTKRLMETRGYSQEKVNQIMKEQMSEWELRSRCDGILENDGDLQYLCEQLQKLLGTI